MINILPPGFKQQISYSKYNVIARRYLLAFIAIGLVVGLALGATHWYADQEIARHQATIAEAETEIEDFRETEGAVASLNAQLTSIEELIEQRPQFSLLLEDIARVLPSGSYTGGISLSEETDQPLQLTITAPSQNQAVRIRDALMESDRIESADIQSISSPSEEDGSVNVSIVVAFEAEEESS